MSIHRLFSALTLISLLLAVAGCANTPMTPEAAGKVPPGAYLVAQSDLINDPLLFTAPGPGQVIFFMYSNPMATFNVYEGNQVTLNAFTLGKLPMTSVTLNGQVVYNSNSRANRNMFYFLPASPASSATTPPK